MNSHEIKDNKHSLVNDAVDSDNYCDTCYHNDKSREEYPCVYCTFNQSYVD